MRLVPRQKAYHDEIIRAVGDAIEAGYRHFDGAAFYANESEVGRAIGQKMTDGVVDRKDLFIVSKVNTNRSWRICMLRHLLYVFPTRESAKRHDLLLQQKETDN